MKTIRVRFPDHVHERMKELANEDGISMNSFIVSSVSEEVARREARKVFGGAASAYDPCAFAEAIAAVADAPVEESDRIDPSEVAP